MYSVDEGRKDNLKLIVYSFIMYANLVQNLKCEGHGVKHIPTGFHLICYMD